MSPRKAANSFEKAQKTHDKLISAEPVGRTALLNSLKRLDETGSIELARENVTTVAFGTVMKDILGSVVELDVQPPLTEDHQALIAGKLSSFELLSDPNTGGGTAPTDTTNIPTSKAKA